jgi:hypothetical protein
VKALFLALDYAFAGLFAALIALYCAKSYLEMKITGTPSRMDLLGALQAHRGQHERQQHHGQDQRIIDHCDRRD